MYLAGVVTLQLGMRASPKTTDLLNRAPSALFTGVTANQINGTRDVGEIKRVAAPMLGGILTSFLLELLVYPAF